MHDKNNDTESLTVEIYLKWLSFFHSIETNHQSMVELFWKNS